MPAFLDIIHFPYGATELKANYRKYLARGLILSILLHFIGLGIYRGVAYFRNDEPPVRVVHIMKYCELGPPPSIAEDKAPAAAKIAVSEALKPSVGIPVPVPDILVNPEQTIASQTELSQMSRSAITEGGNGTQTKIVAEKSDLQIEEDGPPPDFVPFEKPPTVIKSIEPVYPETARRAGIEGKVVVKVWIDKQGQVKDAVVLKSAAEILEEAAINAAKEWEFVPAMMNHGPVDVWSTLVFNFQLKES